MKTAEEVKEHIRMVLDQHDHGLMMDVELAGALLKVGTDFEQEALKHKVCPTTGLSLRGQQQPEPLNDRITARKFFIATGSVARQDDLERSNCVHAGEVGHQDCGWNAKHNKPNFMVPRSDR